MPRKKGRESAVKKQKLPAAKTTKESRIRNALNVLGLKDGMRAETITFLVGLVILLVAVFMILSFTSYVLTGSADQSMLEALAAGKDFAGDTEVNNMGGYLGAKLAYFFMDGCFGIASFFIPLFLIFVAMRLMGTYKVKLWRKFVNYAFLMIWLSVALTFLLPDAILQYFAFPPGGAHGRNICRYITEKVGTPGLFILILASAIFYLIYLSHRTILIIRKLLRPKDLFQKKNLKAPEPSEPEDKPEEPQEAPTYREEKPIEIDLTETEGQEEIVVYGPEKKQPKEKPVEQKDDDGAAMFIVEKAEEETKADQKTLNDPYDPKLDLEFYKYPLLSLLKKYDDQYTSIDMAEQTENKNRITTVLHNFGVEISSIKATVGPTITLYEITPAAGVRISKIKNLEDDIALSLSALGIRIIAPIPGKGTIGIEVPNKKPQIVSIESIINSKKFQESEFELPIALGKTITNEVYMLDLAKAPHLLVAGATGQGKSVGLNAIITSLLYKKHPSELKMVLVDPKKVEFSIYSPLANHFLAKVPDEDSDPIITDVTKVVKTLKSLCKEMDDRYLLLKKAACRNIKEYNAKFKARQLNPEHGHRFLPYFVIIIDEFGDLIMTAGKEVELPIARIAQLARAVGMHMVIATQRPTTNIITGTIKANFPARMAFKVTSMIDSRTILDQSGANQLVGKGDMLILAGTTLPIRVQCAFIDTPEVQQINQYISEQQGYLAPYELPEVIDEAADGGSSRSGLDDGERLDPLFEEAARLIVVHQSGSTSLIQRKFAIGYNRAGRLMDQLERMGIVGPINGAKPRDVLCADESMLQAKLDSFQLENE